ncbi:LD-carboxypeptidase [Roseateles sp. DAIF2]|uniref:S66 peptidase family protein n=1 Tax=Roseateles sp. DAIF2 TaxID=2714952 RepID=UPI0018A31926|nr:LD-carboxypeptidase [Roseateles sp. DAIF2]QPF71787.1 LD-carboxypeptidase [Roseateles sp. DAIF2]
MTSKDLELIAALPEGATLGLIAPAGPPKRESLDRIPALLAAHGFRAKFMPGIAAGPARLDYLAADDATRLADLHAAFADPEVDAVLCLRGGYGCARLLDRIDTALLRRHPKLLIGFSDISSLIGLLDHLGLPSLHAPMPSSNLLEPESANDARALFALLHRGLRRGDVIAPAGFAPHALNRGEGPVRGRLIGGNLAVFTALLGTPWAPRAEGVILFLEDVSEPPYRVDRLLAQLRLAGVLEAAAGFVLGGFTGAEEPADAVLADYFGTCGKPVLAGWPSGHQTPNVALPMGLQVELDVARRRLSYL